MLANVLGSRLTFAAFREEKVPKPGQGPERAKVRLSGSENKGVQGEGRAAC